MNVAEMPSRHVPLDVRRELRKEVNFGCPICGNPLLEYHHIVPFSEEKHHDPDRMIGLCPNHHAEADAGTIKDEKLYNLKQNPVISDVVEHDFQFRSEIPRIELGQSVYCELSRGKSKPVIRLTGKNILSMGFIDGILQFDLNFYNYQNDLVAQIEENDWWVDGDAAMDIKYKKKTLVVNMKDNQLHFGVHYRPEDDIIKIVGVFNYNNKALGVDNDSATIYRPRLVPVELSDLNITGENKPCIEVQ